MNLGLADFHNWREAMNVCNLPEIGARPDLIPDIGRHSQDMRDVVWGARGEPAEAQALGRVP